MTGRQGSQGSLWECTDPYGAKCGPLIDAGEQWTCKACGRKWVLPSLAESLGQSIDG